MGCPHLNPKPIGPRCGWKSSLSSLEKGVIARLARWQAWGVSEQMFRPVQHSVVYGKFWQPIPPAGHYQVSSMYSNSAPSLCKVRGLHLLAPLLSVCWLLYWYHILQHTSVAWDHLGGNSWATKELISQWRAAKPGLQKVDIGVGGFTGRWRWIWFFFLTIFFRY